MKHVLQRRYGKVSQIIARVCRHDLSLWLGMAIFLVAGLFGNESQAAGSWTPLVRQPNSAIQLMLLLTDGTVMCSDGGGNSWYKLTPDSQGSYLNGTWSQLASMKDTRLYYSSAVLKDGRVFVAGGEYGSGTNSAEIYNPTNNTWTPGPNPPAGQGLFYDSVSKIIANGNVLISPVEPATSGGTVIFDYLQNTFVNGPKLFRGFYQDEASWVKLPDDSILTVDPFGIHSERYIPSLNQWINDSDLPVALYDSFGFEMGAGFLLPDGRAFYLGATGHTAIYTPSGSNNPGTWSAGPDIPNNSGTPDAAAAMMVNGKILCAVSPVPTSANHFPTPTTFYEYDYQANTFTQVGAPGGGTSRNEPCYVTCMLDLPDGTVLYSEFSSQLYVYNPNSAPLASGKPTVTSVTKNSDGSYHLAGTLLNGISEGAAYGDDNQMNSNYPIVRLVDGAGTVYYCRTYNWSSTGVMTGSTPESTDFTVPSNLPAGSYSLYAVANGIASDAFSFSTLIVSSTTISINNVSIIESNSPAVFSVTLSSPSAQTVTVNYATSNGSAIAGLDYVATNGLVTFPAGSTNQSINVAIINDLIPETNKTFNVLLSNSTNATLVVSTGVGTIIDDDTNSVGNLDLVITGNTNATTLANALTLSGQSGLTVTSASLVAHTNSSGAVSSGLYTLVGASPHTYQLTSPGVVISSGNVLDYQTGPDTIDGFTTSFGAAETAAQKALLDPITGNFQHFDVTELDINFDVSASADHVVFQVVFGSEEYPDFVNSQFIDGFGIFLNGTNIAFTGGLPININHPAMAAISGTELNGVLAPGGNPVLQFSAAITPGSKNNKLTFIVADTSDTALDTTVYISSLAGLQLLPPTGLIPAITSFAPTNAPIGTPITIQGTNFATIPASNIVYFGSVPAQVTAASANQVTVVAPAGTIYAPPSITVTGLTATASYPFSSSFASDGNLATNAFASKFEFPGNTNPYGMVVADFDGDGKPDLAVASFDQNTISIYRNITTPQSINSGTFATKIDLPTGSGPYALAAADLNGDGKIDLVAVNYNNHTASVFRNTSSGSAISFTTKTDFQVGNNPRGIAIADIDGDGRPDLIVANEGDNTVSVLRNKSLNGNLGTGAFASKVDFFVGTAPTSVAVGDLDGDLLPDIVVANGYNGLGGNSISLLRNTGNTNDIDSTSLATRVNFPVGISPNTVLLADVDNDGKLDVLVLSPVGLGTVSILKNQIVGPGTFSASSLASRVDFFAGSTTRSIAVADLDGDGRVDIIGVNQSAGTFAVLKNTGTKGVIDSNSFAARATYPTTPNPYRVAAADIDVDGRPELISASTNGTVAVLRNIMKSTPLGVWTPPALIPYGTALSSEQLDASFIFNSTNVAGSIVYSPPAGAVLSAGQHILQATFVPIDLSTFNTVTISVPIFVTKGTVTVIPDNFSRAYGAPDPTFTAHYTGFVNNEDASVLSGTPAFSSSDTATSVAGSYYYILASQGTLNSLNYDFNYSSGILTITQAVLTVTANNLQKSYGQPNPTLTYSVVGFANNENSGVLSGVPYLSTTADMNSTPAGSPYPISISAGSLSSQNYSFIFVAGQLTVGKTVLTVTADDKSRSYGAVDPTFTAQITGFVGTDTANTAVTGAPSFTTTATPTSPVNGSPYSIIPAIGTLAATNYTFTFVNGNLTITADDPPVLTLASTALTYTEKDGPKIIDATATVTDGGSADFNGGTLTVTIISGGAAEDRLAIRNQGPGIERFALSGNMITYSGTYIGTFSGGSVYTSPLIITFNPNATPAVAQALVRDLTYENVSVQPSTTPRVIQFVLTDGDGGTSSPTNKTVNVISVNDLPTITLLTPTNSAVFKVSDSNIVFTVSTSDVDGTVAKVEYFANNTKLGESTAGDPFSFTWTNAAIGTYTLTARATDNQNGTKTTPQIGVTVNPSILSVTPGTGQYTLMFNGIPGTKYDVQASTDLVSWTTIGTIMATSSAVPFVDSNILGVLRRFYRIIPHVGP